ncbi:helix-turn-helix transcriptional regulator, partial [Enterobacter hormaechei]
MASVYSDEYQRVINALKKARKEKGITQAQLAEALGKPQSFIAKVESGERRLDVVEFVHLARLLREGANKQVISSQADSLIKISRIWADFFPA